MVALTFAGLVVGCNRKLPEMLCPVLPPMLRETFFKEFNKDKEKPEYQINFGACGLWFYNVLVLPENLFLQVAPSTGRLSLSEVRQYARKVNSPFLVCKPTGASDSKVQRQADKNFESGLLWEANCRL